MKVIDRINEILKEKKYQQKRACKAAYRLRYESSKNGRSAECVEHLCLS